MKYTNFPKNKQTLFLRLIKKKTNYSWKKLGHFLNVSRSMIYFYLNEHSKLPYGSYLRLCNLAKIGTNGSPPSIKIKNKEEEIRIPKLSSKLAEFIGALAGDGHMNRITYEVSISMDQDLDKDYSDHIIGLYLELFNIRARKYTQERYHKTKCFAYSKRLVDLLSNKYHTPIGKKKGNLKIPVQIKKNEELLKSYVRGLFDTDGSFHRHHQKDAMVGIISRDSGFIKEIKCALLKLNFKASLSNKNLYIYKKDQINRFFKEIKPSNKKHTSKYYFYKLYGEVPLTKDLIKR